MRDDAGIYLLIGDYHFMVDADTHKVSKVYMFGFTTQSIKGKMVDKSIANERLKMDYLRLRDCNIEFEEKFF